MLFAMCDHKIQLFYRFTNGFLNQREFTQRIYSRNYLSLVMCAMKKRKRYVFMGVHRKSKAMMPIQSNTLFHFNSNTYAI